MGKNTNPSIMLASKDLELINELQKKLKIKTKIEVIALGLQKLKEEVDRDLLARLYKEASLAIRNTGISYKKNL